MSLRGFKSSIFSKSAVQDEPTIVTNIRARRDELSQYLGAHLPSAPLWFKVEDNVDGPFVEPEPSAPQLIVVAQPITGDTSHLIAAVAVIADSTLPRKPINYGFILAMLGGVVAVLCAGSYLWSSYRQDDNEASVYGLRSGL